MPVGSCVGAKSTILGGWRGAASATESEKHAEIRFRLRFPAIAWKSRRNLANLGPGSQQDILNKITQYVIIDERHPSPIPGPRRNGAVYR